MDQFDFTAQLPSKRMAAGALLLNANSHILVVKPSYRDEWLLPGGIVEAHESPAAACCREVKEELGIEINLGRLLCIEYRSTAPPKTESLQFVFFGGVLSSSQIQAINLAPDEINEYRFITVDDAQNWLSTLSAQRVRWARKALQNGGTVYGEDGVEQSC